MASSDEEHLAIIKEKWEGRTKSTEQGNALTKLFDGTDYLTIGYYETPSDSLAESVLNMTRHLSDKSEINSTSHVLDLGCGRGRPLLDIAARFRCSVVGVDLAKGHIDIANQSLLTFQEQTPHIKAEFHAASYFDLPEVVTKQRFSNVVMQTSLFYAHHRIDDILKVVSQSLVRGGVFAATDFYRKSDKKSVKNFMDVNSMKDILTLDELKAAFGRHDMQYTGGTNLDSHCIKCNQMKSDKLIRENINYPQTNFQMRRDYVNDGKITFQLVIAKKL